MPNLEYSFHAFPSISLLFWPPEGQSRFSSECGHVTLGCKILDHSSRVFSSDCPETPFTLSVLATRGPICANTGQNRLFWGGGHDESACHNSDHSFNVLSLEYPPPPPPPPLNKFFWPPEGRNWANIEYFWRWLGYISMPHFGPFLPCVLHRMLANLIGRTDIQADFDADQCYVPIRLC